ncbi:relaxase/mobilization nuclease domain protein [Klebsiella phage ST437-OXA245phi4.1]|uniref:Relaxase/mobilization nuclease domain protein n=1 Tax=Klebsiella phage ST437-OXA245phi4.1 TaxID=2510486 RepID=A0A482IJ39_9CAUD|nr:relaxase/mobilization nuclease domain protein [Klebsiella phage ST437-OXA245phi4.1]QBP08066.1 relaxase/mobilization nuclease domain protein [Klebsiella phage ST437-OXA245phi4.1]
MPSIYPAQSKENSLNPNLLGLLIGPTKSSVVFALPITRPPSQDKTTHNISHNPFTLRPRPRPEG